jgi:hypothetical protein
MYTFSRTFQQFFSVIKKLNKNFNTFLISIQIDYNWAEVFCMKKKNNKIDGAIRRAM